MSLEDPGFRDREHLEGVESELAITREEVEHVARLARLGLTDEEVERFTEQLSRILEHVAALQRVDTTGVSPTFHVLPLKNVLRADEVQESLPRQEALARAPGTGPGTFKVPRITEG